MPDSEPYDWDAEEHWRYGIPKPTCDGCGEEIVTIWEYRGGRYCKACHDDEKARIEGVQASLGELGTDE